LSQIDSGLMTAVAAASCAATFKPKVVVGATPQAAQFSGFYR